MTLTKRQANTIIGGILAILLMQIMLGFVFLHGQQVRREVEAATVTAEDTLKMQKQAAGRPSLTFQRHGALKWVGSDGRDILATPCPPAVR